MENTKKCCNHKYHVILFVILLVAALAYTCTSLVKTRAQLASTTALASEEEMLNYAAISKWTQSTLLFENEFLLTDHLTQLWNSFFTIITPESPGELHLYLRNIWEDPIVLNVEITPETDFKASDMEMMGAFLAPGEEFPYDEVKLDTFEDLSNIALESGELKYIRVTLKAPKPYSGMPSYGAYTITAYDGEYVYSESSTLVVLQEKTLFDSLYSNFLVKFRYVQSPKARI